MTEDMFAIFTKAKTIGFLRKKANIMGLGEVSMGKEV